MALSECACRWEGSPSRPRLVSACVAHLEWRNGCTADARREAPQIIADALARRCADAVKAGDVALATRMADAQKCVAELYNGQQLVARWEGPNSGWSEAADLALAIDEAIAAERERCCQIVFGQASSDNAAQRTVDAIRGRRRARKAD